MEKLLTLERKRVDPHRLYGYPVNDSDDLLLLHNNVDFIFDGYVVVRWKDITHQHEEDDNFHTKVIKKEGLWERVPAKIKKLPLDSWGSLLKCFVGKVVILENERKDDFYIGPVVEVGEKSVTINYIDGRGEMMGKEKIPFSRITQMRFGDKYSTILAKYLHEAAA